MQLADLVVQYHKNIFTMATNEIKLGINLRQNKNSKNAGYGKYYPEVDTQTTLTLRGFAKHMSDHGCIYGLEHTVPGSL